MKYTSTRDKSVCHKFEQAVCSGYAPNGGLYVPEHFPYNIAAALLNEWIDLNYSTLTYRVLRPFIGRDEISDDDLITICQSTLEGFDDPSVPVVDVVVIGDDDDDESQQKQIVKVVELWHGPTFCFKDLGLRFVCNLLSYFCENTRNNRTTIVVATTGDTGPAAVRAVADVNSRRRGGSSGTSNHVGSNCTSVTQPPLLSILVHYPQGQISDFQRRQLTTFAATTKNSVRVVAFEGGGDDMDVPIKRILASASSSSGGGGNNDDNDHRHMLTGVNSYNIGRPLMQMVHFIWTYLRINEDAIRESSSSDALPAVDFVVPTGAMGNLVGGYMAKKMGLPIRKLVAGVNVNDVTDRTFRTGKFRRNPTMHKTLSDAINIQVPYNIERLLYYLVDGDHELIRRWMKQIDETQQLDVGAMWLEKLQADFASSSCTDEEVCDTIRYLVDEYDYWVDPHTAVAWCAAEKLGYIRKKRRKGRGRGDADVGGNDNSGFAAGAAAESGVSCCEEKEKSDSPLVSVLSTASPCKFQETMVTAMGRDRWKQYMQSERFPSAAKQLYERDEVEPIVFKATHPTLEKNQVEWEKLARDILDELAAGKGSAT